MSQVQVILPSIPTPDIELLRAVKAIKEIVEVREGRKPQAVEDRFVSVRELTSLIVDNEEIVYYLTTAHTHAHSALTGLTAGDDHTQYALLAGRVGGQILNGGDTNLTLRAGGTVNVSDLYLDAEDDIVLRDYNAGSPATRFTFDMPTGNYATGGQPVTTARQGYHYWAYTNAGESRQLLYADMRPTVTASENFSSAALFFYNRPTISSGQTVNNNAYGTYTYVMRSGLTASDQGTLLALYGAILYYGHVNTYAGTPITGNIYGIYLSPTYQTGTITSNVYDIYLNSPATGATLSGTHYGIYQASSSVINRFYGTSYFNAQVKIGDVVAPVCRLEVEDGATAASMLFKITQDDSNVYAMVIGNDTYSTNDLNGMRFYLSNTGDAHLQCAITTPAYLPFYMNALVIYLNTVSNGDVQIHATSGGTYNGNFLFDYNDRYPQLVFRFATTPVGVLQADVNTGDMTLNAYKEINLSDVYIQFERNVVFRDYNAASPQQVGLLDNGGNLYLGRNDAENGSVNCYGHFGTTAEGGRVSLYMSENFDTTYEKYDIRINEDDLIITRTGLNDLMLASTGIFTMANNVVIGSGAAGVDYTLTFNGETNDGTITWMEDEATFALACNLGLLAGSYFNFGATYGAGGYGFFDDAGAISYKDSGGAWIKLNTLGGGASNPLNIGTDDTTYGVINVYGHGAGSVEGGEIKLYTAADHDATYDYYRIKVSSDDLIIGRLTNTDLVIDEAGYIGLNVADPLYPFHQVRAYTNPAAGQYYNHFIDVDASGTATGAANIYGSYVDLDSAMIRDTYTCSVYGYYSAVNGNNGCNLSNLYGMVFYAQADVGSIVGNMYGVNGNITHFSAFGTPIASMRGVYTAVSCLGAVTYTVAYGVQATITLNNASATLDTAYGLYSLVQRTNGTLTTAYGAYITMSGTIANKWGLYVTGEAQNYFSHMVGIGMAPLADLLQVGDGTNYSTFEADGTLRFVGTATVFDDLRVPVTSVLLDPGGSVPNWTAYKGGYVAAFEDNAVEAQEDVVYFTAQIPHGYKEGTDIVPHVHWVGEDTTAGNVRWKLTYSWANIDAAFPAETTDTVDDANNAGTADGHNKATFAAISGAGKTISSMLICSLRRNSSHANDTFTAKDAYLLEIDFHYEMDTVGSRAVTTK